MTSPFTSGCHLLTGLSFFTRPNRFENYILIRLIKGIRMQSLPFPIAESVGHRCRAGTQLYTYTSPSVRVVTFKLGNHKQIFDRCGRNLYQSSYFCTMRTTVHVAKVSTSLNYWTEFLYVRYALQAGQLNQVKAQQN